MIFVRIACLKIQLWLANRQLARARARLRKEYEEEGHDVEPFIRMVDEAIDEQLQRMYPQ